MEFTREIYWNVGHGAATLVPMYLLALGALALLGWFFARRAEAYRRGRPLGRSDRFAARLGTMLGAVLLQRPVLRGGGAGLLHGLFFWAFVVLAIGTTLVFIQADITDPLFDVVFLTGTFYKFFSVALDTAGLLGLVTLAGLAVRRWVIRPDGLPVKADDAIMHGLLAAILLTGFVVEGARMAVTELGTPLAPWSPVGLAFALPLAGIGEAGLRGLHRVTWWLHLALVIGFIVLIPLTKFRHILTTSLNHFFADKGPTGKLISLDLEDEEAETFGAAKVGELSWKDLFDGDACTLCKRCQDRCPAWVTGKPLSPMAVVSEIGDAAHRETEVDLLEAVGRESIWACTTCRACEDICPAAIEHVAKIVELRRSMVLMEGTFPGEEVMTAMGHTEVNFNPLGSGYASRGDWCEGLGLAAAEGDEPYDVIYFVGCYASFDKRNIAVARSFVSLCAAAGVRAAVLGRHEKCCGEPMRKMGNEYLYQSLAGENVELLNGCRADTIVTTCPHCYNTLAKDYRDFGLRHEVLCHSEYLKRLLDSGALRVEPEPFSCTYHDSCYLGRHNGIYEAPRDLVGVAGGSIIEMDQHRADSFCCSAGGGRIMADETSGERISHRRVKMAAATGAPELLSSCPFCLTMFEDGVKGVDLEEALRPRDIAEVLAERLPAG